MIFAEFSWYVGISFLTIGYRFFVNVDSSNTALQLFVHNRSSVALTVQNCADTWFERAEDKAKFFLIGSWVVFSGIISWIGLSRYSVAYVVPIFEVRLASQYEVVVQ